MLVRRRHGWLVLVAGLHLAMLASWRFTALRTRPPAQQREGEIIFLAQVQRSLSRQELSRAPAGAAPSRRRAMAQPAPVAAATPLAAPAESAAPMSAQPPTEAAPDPFAQPAPVVDSVLERSRRAAIGIDRQLRKESKNDNDRILVRESKFAQDLALAYKGSGAFSMAETVLPNGDSLARVTTPLGSYCILKRGNRNKAGLNAIDNAGKTYIVTCPK